jgi:prophage maintenance system killer protein
MVIARTELGDDPSVDHERLAEAVAEPLRRDEGREVFPGVVPKAAALLLALLRLRPFARANARVALLATTVFLNRNGLDLEPHDDDLIALVAVAATGELTVLQTAAALERFVVRLTPPFE